MSKLILYPGTDSILPDLQTDQAQDELDVSSIIKEEVEEIKQVLLLNHLILLGILREKIKDKGRKINVHP